MSAAPVFPKLAELDAAQVAATKASARLDRCRTGSEAWYKNYAEMTRTSDAYYTLQREAERWERQQHSAMQVIAEGYIYLATMTLHATDRRTDRAYRLIWTVMDEADRLIYGYLTPSWNGTKWVPQGWTLEWSPVDGNYREILNALAAWCGAHGGPVRELAPA